jgi:hypothetical protein
MFILCHAELVSASPDFYQYVFPRHPASLPSSAVAAFLCIVLSSPAWDDTLEKFNVRVV